MRAPRPSLQIGLYGALLLATAVALTPLAWLVAAVFKDPEDFFHYLFFPPLGALTLHNFVQLFTELPFARYLANSLFLTGTSVLLQVFVASLGGFALAKYQFPGKRVVTLVMLAMLTLPSQIMLAPTYEIVYRLGLIDTYAGLILPVTVSVFGMFLFRQAISGVPEELYDAGRIDGAGEFRLYWDVTLPVVRPMTGAFCLISFMGQWNSFIWPQLIFQSQEHFTLPMAINTMQGTYRTEYGLIMTATLLSIVPVAALFLLLQKEFISGLTSGAVKG
jgi:ABC-type glycerol-3-phosphate transport system permease component